MKMLIRISKFFFPAISRDDGEDAHHHHHHHRGGHGHNHGNKVPYNGYNSEEYLDRLEPNGNIPSDKSNCRYGGKFLTLFPMNRLPSLSHQPYCIVSCLSVC